jgi:nickel-dependent lactate racemase
MKIRLAYGKEGLEVEVPDRNLAQVLAPDATSPLTNPEDAVRELLKRPIGSLPLAELARGVASACIVVCDITRPVPNTTLLPPVLQTLEEQGLRRDAITILVGTGLHRPSTQEELQLILGDLTKGGYRIIHHRARVQEEQSYLGETRRKTRVFIDKAYCDAGLKITVGFIEPHLMAGFSGGCKMTAIGCAGDETIKRLHSPFFLDDARCREGSFENNPLHHELLEISKMAGHDFCVDVSLDAARRITGVFAGGPGAAHAAGVEAVRRFVRSTLKEPADIVITTSAGFPLDLTYYQSIKGMTAALPIVKKGGMLILAAECAEGLGSPSFAAMAGRFSTAEEFEDWIHRNPVEIDQWQLQECAKAARHAEIVLVSRGIRRDEQEKLFVRSSRSVEEAVAWGLTQYGSDASIAVIPRGPYTLVELDPSPI